MNNGSRKHNQYNMQHDRDHKLLKIATENRENSDRTRELNFAIVRNVWRYDF